MQPFSDYLARLVTRFEDLHCEPAVRSHCFSWLVLARTSRPSAHAPGLTITFLHMPESHLASAFRGLSARQRYQLLLKRLREARTQAGLSQSKSRNAWGSCSPSSLASSQGSGSSTHRVRELCRLYQRSARYSPGPPDLGSPLGPRPEVCLLALSFPPLPNHATSVINSTELLTQSA